MCWWQADIRAMRPAYEEAVEIWRKLGDKCELANALYNFSFVFSVPEDPTAIAGPIDRGRAKASAAQAEALALYRELGDERGEGNVLWGMGNKKYFSEQPDAGRRRVPRCAREVPPRRGSDDGGVVAAHGRQRLPAGAAA